MRRLRGHVTVRVWYGPEPHQFFYCDRGVIDESPDLFASGPEMWLAQNPDREPAFPDLDELAEF